MAEDTTYRKLYVRGISLSTSVTGLRDYFLQFGAVSRANIVVINGESTGHGYVTFVNPQDALTASLSPYHIIDGTTVNCNLAAFPPQVSQPSSPYLGPRMHFGPPAPHPYLFPYFPYPVPYTNPYMSPNNPIHGPEPMHSAGPIPPVYPYGQGSLWNECVTGNTLETTLATTSNTSQNVGPMYGPRSMTGLSSGSNGAATDMVHFRNPNYPMYDTVSLLDQHDQRPPGRNEPSGTGYFHPVTSQNRRNTGQNDGDRRGGGPMRRQEK